MSRRGGDVELLGEPSEHEGKPGSVILTWTLSSAPDVDWVKAFNHTNVSYSGPGALDFQAIPPPAVNRTSVRWAVPPHLKQHAGQYIQQRVDRANADS